VKIRPRVSRTASILAAAHTPSRTGIASVDHYAVLVFALFMSSASLSTAHSVAHVQGPGVRSARDAREPQVLAMCEHATAPSAFKAPPGFKPPSSGEAHEYSIIDGVIAAGARIVQPGLCRSIWELQPQRKLLAERYFGDPLNCLHTVRNDLGRAK
jgi:hypothetical protein